MATDKKIYKKQQVFNEFMEKYHPDLCDKWRKEFEINKMNETNEKKELGRPLVEEVIQIINHDRQDSYGKPEHSFSSIAWRWTEYIKNRYGVNISLTADDVEFMMMELKMARESVKHKRDNLVDLVGYTCILDGD